MRVREFEDFETLKPFWDTLLKESLFGATIFSTWEWQSTWWRHFGKKGKLMILAVEDKNNIIGISPLMFSKYKLPVFGNVNKIEFISSKESDYSSFIFQQRGQECARLILDYLVKRKNSWDLIELKEIPENLKKPDLVQTLRSIETKLHFKAKVCNLCPYLTLPLSFDSLRKNLYSRMQRNLKRRLKKICKDHRVQFMRFDEFGFSPKEAIATLFKLNSARWTSKNLPGANVNYDFHFDLAETLASRGWLGLYFLVADDVPVSAEYTFEYGRKIYAYLSGFDPDFSKYSVGHLAVLFLLERAIRHGFAEYDMLRGAEPYKLNWSNSWRKNYEVRLSKRNVIGECYNFFTWNSFLINISRKLNLSSQVVASDNVTRN